MQRSLVNAYLSWRRTWSRHIPHAAVLDQPAPGSGHAARIAERSELAAEIARLPHDSGPCWFCIFYSGIAEIAEIAEALGCRSATVRGYVSRGLKTLRGALT